MESSKKFRESLYQCIQTVCVQEALIRDDDDACRAFCDDPFWKGKTNRPDIGKPDRFLHFMLLFMCGDTPDANKNASLYKRAAEKLMASNLPREEIAKKLQKVGGIKKAASAGNQVEESKQAPKALSSTTSKVAVKSDKGPSQPTLEIEMREGELSDFLDCAKGDEVEITIKMIGAKADGFKRFKLTDYDL